MALLTKVCSKCHTERLSSFFRRTTTILGGYQPVCSICAAKGLSTLNRKALAYDYLDEIAQANKNRA